MLLGKKVAIFRQSLAAAVMVFAMIRAAHGQSDISDVHIQPRSQSSVQSGTPAWSSEAQTGIIRKRVDLVLVPVTVTDGSNRLVTGLDEDNFRVFEGKEAQQIRHFSCDDAPVSVGILLDVSGSMKSKIDRAREAVMELLRTSNPQDEFFLVTFADAPRVVQDFTPNPDEMRNHLLFTEPKGRTALLDAIYLAIGNMKRAKYQRKAILIISDGGDNRSRYSEHEVKSEIKEADVLVYSIGIFDADFRTEEERLGPALLSEISETTGAASFTIDNPNDLPDIARRISMELRNQYVLAYRPTTSTHDGKYHKIKVKLITPHGLPSLHAQARTGYYAASE